MIDLGVGLNLEMTGHENVLLYGALLGRDPDELRREAPAIAEWAGLEEFMDVPVRSYSTGMLVRLAFAVATASTPDVLLIDEALSVGDAGFVERSRERLELLMRHGTAVVLVSHALELVQEQASTVLWLDHGRARSLGDPATVIEAYREAPEGRIELADDPSEGVALSSG
jgi:ABC-type polysaccharide/polyol phosphate transport system ATPase subunit